MAKHGRNEPCHCGSGEKYKRCCLAKDEAASATQRAAQHATAAAHKSPLLRLPDVPGEIAEDLDAASNGVLDLIHAGKLDEAEEAARHLLERFPQVHDGYDRLGMVFEARGDRKQAAACYRKVVEFIREHPEGYAPEFEEMFRKQAERLDPSPVAS
jgi:tetratricopeptide (TPR) repeat protein